MVPLPVAPAVNARRLQRHGVHQPRPFPRHQRVARREDGGVDLWVSGGSKTSVRIAPSPNGKPQTRHRNERTCRDMSCWPSLSRFPKAGRRGGRPFISARARRRDGVGGLVSASPPAAAAAAAAAIAAAIAATAAAAASPSSCFGSSIPSSAAAGPCRRVGSGTKTKTPVPGTLGEMIRSSRRKGRRAAAPAAASPAIAGPAKGSASREGKAASISAAAALSDAALAPDEAMPPPPPVEAGAGGRVCLSLLPPLPLLFLLCRLPPPPPPPPRCGCR